MRFSLNIWRQANQNSDGGFRAYAVDDVSADMSFLEMLDVLNERLVGTGEEPVAFDHDCREGICGTCSLVVNGMPHGPQTAATTCQLHMRKFTDGQEIWVEPWRAAAFPILKDLVCDRSAFDRIVQAGGYVSVGTGAAPDANAIAVSKELADRAMDAASCIGCGACVAACPNASAMLFTAAKMRHLNLLPQGQPERDKRAMQMVAQMDAEGFGACTNHLECEAACPKEISTDFIAEMNIEVVRAALLDRGASERSGGVG
ncbi:MAG: succinate dehydrogenase/fumarate reductase iron-sulfur subunit [Myxococcales bacterium]|nr:succinate dehydrogenase/fumarate reductase iron-sulfur subunit [Myxococcales bacterium]